MTRAASIAAACVAVYAADTWAPGPGWTVVFADEFDGVAIDSQKWGFDRGRNGYFGEPGWGNGELQEYTSSSANASVVNGELRITAVRESDGRYSSARLKTMGHHSWTYGKIAARIRLPYGQGIWPAFWMLGANILDVGWPKCGEIDIMEMFGGADRDNTVHGTLHWDAGNPNAAAFGTADKGTPAKAPAGKIFNDDFHVFEVEWTSSEIIWRINSIEFFRTSVDTALCPTISQHEAGS